MAKKDRASYALKRVGNMLRWLALSGTITFLLVQVQDGLGQVEVSPEVSILAMVIINTLLFAVRSYVEGEKK